MRKKSILVISALCLSLMSCGSLGTGTTTGTSTSTGSILGDVINVLGNTNTISNVLSSVIGTDKVTQAQLEGTWRYSGPGCAFTSEKALAKAGGEVVASQIKQKMLPTYQKLGLSNSNTYITLNADKTFAAKIDGKSMSGKYTYEESTGRLVLQGILLNANCYAKRSGSGVCILFEAKKLLTMLQTVAALSGNQSIQTIGQISSNYDGVRLGFDLAK